MTDAGQKRSASILTPTIDFLLVGGLSLILFVPLLLSGRLDLLLIGATAQAWFATLFNMPHFMASYRIVYRSRDMIMRHKWAAIYVPVILLLYALFAFWASQSSRVPLIIFVSVASAYLAWHYTGQVWGMMASYTYLGGSSFEKSERFLIRSGLRILLAWHVTWFLYTQLRDPSTIRPLYELISMATVAAFGLGLAGIIKMRRRTGKFPPARALVAWLALFAWYAVMARDPRAIFWIQIAHALQYLAFPIRVEINRTSGPEATRGRLMTHMLVYGLGLLALSYALQQLVPAAAMGIVAEVFGAEPAKAAPILVLMFINIHHYFTDGVIWKISNPEVRKELFAHVPRAEASAKPVKAPTTRPATQPQGASRR